VAICAEVADALATAHDQGVVHRDISPGNVMLTASGAKVVDFGISALAGEVDLDADGNLLGTPAYLAPERIDGRPVLPASDVYALGVVLYRALTGRLPWSAGTTDGLLLAHVCSPPQPLPDIDGLPPEVAALCLECLEKRPELRPTAAEVAQRLSGTLGVPVSVPAGPSVALPLGTRPLGARPEAAAERTLTGLTARSRQLRVWLTSVLHVPGEALAPRGRRRRLFTLMTAALLLLFTAVGWAGTTQRSGGVALAVGVDTGSVCLVQYQVQRDWGTGFTAALAVTNNGAAPVDGWRLTFAFPGEQRITTANDARWNQDGRAVTAGPADPDGWLDAGATARFHLTASYRGHNPLPVAFALDGRDCEALVAGTPGVVPEPPPAASSSSASEGDDHHKGKDKGRGRD